jgi:hypothetical protein
MGGSGWFVRAETYDRDIYDPDSPVVKDAHGEPVKDDHDVIVHERQGKVTLRPLNSGDRTELEDNVRMEVGNEEATPQMLLGTMRRMTVERAIVGWTLEEDVNTMTIRRLNPGVFEQIFAAITFGNVPAEQALATPTTEQVAPKQEPAADAADPLTREHDDAVTS